jgi:hypothetical protein
MPGHRVMVMPRLRAENPMADLSVLLQAAELLLGVRHARRFPSLLLLGLAHRWRGAQDCDRDSKT